MSADAVPLAAVPERSPLAGHILALDGVRGVAILLVLAFHFIAHGPGFGAWPAWVVSLARNGWAGVDLFFVLSGFLITRILLNLRGRPGAMRVFYARRALRIFPLYYAMLLVVGGFLLVQSRLAPSRGESVNFAAAALYLTNFNVAVQENWGVAVFRSLQLTHLWTLAIEEQFYLLWPVVVLWLPRRIGYASYFLLIVGAPILRHLLLAHGTPSLAVYVLTPCRADALAWGAMLAYAEADRPAVLKSRGWLLLIGGTALSAVILSPPSNEYSSHVQTIGYTVLAALSAGMVALCAAHALPRSASTLLGSRPLTLLGRYSYGIYLFHLPLRGLASSAWRAAGYDPAYAPLLNYESAFLKGPPLSLLQALLSTILLTAGSVFFAWASFHVFEQRFLRRKPTITPPPAFEPIFERR